MSHLKKTNPVEIIPLQTTRKENNWKTEETLAGTIVTLETERIKVVQSLMFMMMMMINICHVCSLISNPISVAFKYLRVFISIQTNVMTQVKSVLCVLFCFVFQLLLVFCERNSIRYTSSQSSCMFEELGLLSFTFCVLVKYVLFVSFLCAVHKYRRFAACVTLLVLYVR